MVYKDSKTGRVVTRTHRVEQVLGGEQVTTIQGQDAPQMGGQKDGETATQ